ncbi:HSP20-like chaperone [Lyophyllum atratum]|nr:HSP20-like chaperone [Lyophyllum atratum]
MSISRQLFRDLFRALEEPLVPVRPGRSGGFGHVANRTPLFGLGQPPMNVKEEKDKYIVEAEVPGVKKDNLEVRIGDDGRSVTVEGKLVQASDEAASSEGISTDMTLGSSTSVTTTDEGGNELPSERTFVGGATFRRTVWLPRPVDSKSVSASLDHGILKLTIKKADDKGSTVVPIE